MNTHFFNTLHFRWTFLVGLSVVVTGCLLMAEPAFAQAFSLDLGQGGPTATERLIQLFLLVTVMALAPSILIMTTSLIRIIIVLSFLLCHINKVILSSLVVNF